MNPCIRRLVYFCRLLSFQPVCKYKFKELFAPYEQYSKKDCTEVVGTYYGWDYCLSRCDKEDCTVPIIEAKNRAYNYAVNSLWIWRERNILLQKLLT